MKHADNSGKKVKCLCLLVGLYRKMRAKGFEPVHLPPLQVMLIQVLEDYTQGLALKDNQHQRHESEIKIWTIKA